MDHVLTTSPFLLELLHFEDEEYLLQVSMVSRLSCFFRLLEELLVQIHATAMASATFVETDRDYDSGSGSGDDDEDGRAGSASADSGMNNGNYSHDIGDNNSHNDLHTRTESAESAYSEFSQFSSSARAKLPSLNTSDKGGNGGGGSTSPRYDMTKYSMMLKPRDRDLLIARLKISIAYAAAWGTGGIYHGSARAKIFDHVVRAPLSSYSYRRVYPSFLPSFLPPSPPSRGLDCLYLLPLFAAVIPP